ncbi:MULTISPECIES: peptide MFS transporter [Myroides]|uniref:MFS transporter n=1 Tax=Myroides albus TaxID=2562892 RepID=A0A6I3LKC6_9FLAO|nr:MULTISPECIES: peptide MFS transporter [Myroides]MTG96961.1 MFS transporter [Myroides albus]MVX35346.1 MFS transporter [Myroides sp. LoEW2-1]UVD78287.1 peptide MFS transporter [Myroides albus]
MSQQQTLEEIQNFEGKYPKQIWSLFFSEMWERFSFYGMRGMLVFFMIHQLDFAQAQANLQYGATQAFVYAFTFLGGIFADKILGFRKSLFWGGAMMILGSVILAIDPHKFFFEGIAFTVIGTGFFKPNISTMVGYLYKKGDNRTDAGFSLFYAGINLGALIGGYLCIAIGKGHILSSYIDEAHRWNVAFGLAAFVMLISLINFIFTKRHLGPIGLQPKEVSKDGQEKRMPLWKEVGTYILTFAMVPVIVFMIDNTEYTAYFMYTVGPLALLYLIYEMTKLTNSERKKIIAALVFIFFSILFFGIYEQAGGSLSIFAAQNLNSDLLGMHLDPNGVNNSGGAFFIIFIAPILGLLWIWLAKKGIEPNTVVKFGLGFVLLGAGYYALFATRLFADLQGMTSLDFFTFALLIITLGELCLSPIGLSIMTKLSTANLQGMMMGMWFLASAYGQYMAGIIGAAMSTSDTENVSNYEALIAYTDGYKELGLYAVIAGILLIALSPLMKKLMQDVR